MNTKDFDYNLPEDLIAQAPCSKRDESRLMVVHRDKDLIEHRHFGEIKKYLLPGDVLVINDTKVIPARIFAKKEKTGATIEVLLLRQMGENEWEALVRPGKRAKVGTKLIFKEGLLQGEVIDSLEGGVKKISFQYEGEFLTVLSKIGQTPLPPYIKAFSDPSRYQTIYAKIPGSVAAPTAGLHFTSQLLKEIEEMGVRIVSVLLHVGLGTFRPVSEEIIEEHKMHQEYYSISQEAANIINEAKKKSLGRIIGVGTTTIRCLESAVNEKGEVEAKKGLTDIFIYPGYSFKLIDSMITNFHLPCSTLLMLVSAFADKEKIMRAYNLAVLEKYRFFSFGDAMLIL